MSEKTNILVKNTPNGITFTINNQSHTLSPKGIKELKNHLSQWIEWYDHHIYFARKYQNYSLEKIDEQLNANEVTWYNSNKVYKYCYMNDFVLFLHADKNIATEIIKENWNKEFPQWENELTFDTGTTYCYVYTKDREIAKTYLWWSYNKYIKPEIDEFVLTNHTF